MIEDINMEIITTKIMLMLEAVVDIMDIKEEVLPCHLMHLTHLPRYNPMDINLNILE
jgi:hypothetical protein